MRKNLVKMRWNSNWKDEFRHYHLWHWHVFTRRCVMGVYDIIYFIIDFKPFVLQKYILR